MTLSSRLRKCCRWPAPLRSRYSGGKNQILDPHLRAQDAETIIAVVEAHDQQPGWNPHAFTDGLARSLADGEFRLVFVLDNVPDELVQVVGYLQLVASRIEIDLITVSAYEVNGSRILVPQRIEPARRSPELTEAEAIARQVNALQPGSDEFRTVVSETATGDRVLLNRLADWADNLDRRGLVRLSTFRGKAALTTLLPRLAGDNVGLVTIYCDKGRGYLQFWRSVFHVARRAASHGSRRSATKSEVATPAVT